MDRGRMWMEEQPSQAGWRSRLRCSPRRRWMDCRQTCLRLPERGVRLFWGVSHRNHRDEIMQDRSKLLTELRLPESMKLDEMSIEQAVAMMNQQDIIAAQ